MVTFTVYAGRGEGSGTHPSFPVNIQTVGDGLKRPIKPKSNDGSRHLTIVLTLFFLLLLSSLKALHVTSMLQSTKENLPQSG